MRRNFFCLGNEDKKKFHLVKWEEVIKNKKEGRLGIRNMNKQNKSLMLKWLWKFIVGENMLWREVIRAKYEMENRWMTKMVTTPVSLYTSPSPRDTERSRMPSSA